MAGKEPWDSSDEKAKELKISDFGTPEEVREMAKMPGTAGSFAEARVILEGIADKPMTGKSGLSATISKKSIKEILSGRAVGKSANLQAHLMAAANLEKLYSNAIEKWKFELDPNKNNDSLEDRKYLYSPMEHNGKIMPVKLTVKKYKDIWTDRRLYSIEAIDVADKKIGNTGNLSAGVPALASALDSPQYPHRQGAVRRPVTNIATIA